MTSNKNCEAVLKVTTHKRYRGNIVRKLMARIALLRLSSVKIAGEFHNLETEV
jgi:hypothetical protein